jgi:hypothetical protein
LDANPRVSAFNGLQKETSAMLTCRCRTPCLPRNAKAFFFVIDASGGERRIRSRFFLQPFLRTPSKHAVEHIRASLRDGLT